MTDSVTCDRCDTSVPRGEWKRHANATIQFDWLEEGSLNNHERGPLEKHLCGECAEWIAGELGNPIPHNWDRWSADDTEAGR